MTTPLKIAAVATTSLVLTACSGTGSIAPPNLPVRDGPQTPAPRSLVQTTANNES